MSKKTKKSKMTQASIESRNNYIYDTNEERELIKSSGFASVCLGWAFIFAVLVPVFLWWMTEYDIQGFGTWLAETLSEQLALFLPYIIAGVTILVCVLIGFLYSPYKYRIGASMVISVDKKCFQPTEEVCQAILKPGMSVKVIRTVKGMIFGYADVVISTSLGADHSKVVLHNVRKYNEVAELIKGIIHNNSVTATRSILFDI